VGIAITTKVSRVVGITLEGGLTHDIGDDIKTGQKG
jgi:hypothetical protein